MVEMDLWVCLHSCPNRFLVKTMIEGARLTFSDEYYILTLPNPTEIPVGNENVGSLGVIITHISAFTFNGEVLIGSVGGYQDRTMLRGDKLVITDGNPNHKGKSYRLGPCPCQAKPYGVSIVPMDTFTCIQQIPGNQLRW